MANIKEHGQERIKLFNELQNLFKNKTGFNIPFDNTLAYMTGRWELNIFEVDRLINLKFGSTQKVPHVPMDAVEKFIGERAVEIIKLLIE